MTDHTTTPAAAAWRRPGTLAELRAALAAFSGWNPVERARRAPELIEATKAVMADERSFAMRDAKDSGIGVTELARALGVARQKIYDTLHRAAAAPGAGPATAAPTAVSGHRLLYDGAGQAWLVLDGDGQVLADHDRLGAEPQDAAAARSWATSVLVDEGVGPVDWQQRTGAAGELEYTARPAGS